MNLNGNEDYSTPAIDPNPFRWGLSVKAAQLLLQQPEILEDLAHDRQLPPLPPGYVPTVVEVLFDDVPYLRSVNGQLVFVRPCSPDYVPLFTEWRMDDQPAVFHVGGEYVVNRVEGIAMVMQQLGFLKEGH